MDYMQRKLFINYHLEGVKSIFQCYFRFFKHTIEQNFKLILILK